MLMFIGGRLRAIKNKSIAYRANIGHKTIRQKIWLKPFPVMLSTVQVIKVWFFVYMHLDTMYSDFQKKTLQRFLEKFIDKFSLKMPVTKNCYNRYHMIPYVPNGRFLFLFFLLLFLFRRLYFRL